MLNIKAILSTKNKFFQITYIFLECLNNYYDNISVDLEVSDNVENSFVFLELCGDVTLLRKLYGDVNIISTILDYLTKSVKTN